jgi:sucrose phosphorylase
MSPHDVILNLYPDSVGPSLSHVVSWLRSAELSETFSLCYVLPSLFRSDLDRGFSVVAYELDERVADESDLADLRDLGVELKLDLVVNHLSAGSPQFQDLLIKGAASEYHDMFIDWNEFWEGRGEPDDSGCIVPEPACLNQMFMRKPGIPVLAIQSADGTNRFYWNTFYQRVSRRALNARDKAVIVEIDPSAAKLVPLINDAVERGRDVDQTIREHCPGRAEEVIDYVARHCVVYQGQIDLNAESPLTWKFYQHTISRLAAFGARVIRLDAFAYLHKQPGRTNFLNEPGTWEYLDRLREMAAERDVTVLPEIHSRYGDGTHRKLAERGFLFYDFFLPGLIIHAIETGSGSSLKRWIDEIVRNDYQTVTLLGCHDGIPILDLEGFLDGATIERLVALVVERGGRIKNIYSEDGQQIAYYQVNATFFSALGEETRKLLLARALQVFTPGTPQIWYFDLLAGVNDHRAADLLGHKEINRTNIKPSEARARLHDRVVEEQLALLRLRRGHPAFGDDAEVRVTATPDGIYTVSWTRGDHRVRLVADLVSLAYTIQKTP